MNTTTTITTTGAGWQASARCAQTDPEVFYPLNLNPHGPAVAAARLVCAGCPVQASCLLDVMAGEDPARRWGITAGLTPSERAALYAAGRAPATLPGALAA